MLMCTVESTGFLLYWGFFLTSRIGRNGSEADKISMNPKVEITSSRRLNIFAIGVFFLFRSLVVVAMDTEVQVTAVGLLTYPDDFTCFTLFHYSEPMASPVIH